MMLLHRAVILIISVARFLFLVDRQRLIDEQGFRRQADVRFVTSWRRAEELTESFRFVAIATQSFFVRRDVQRYIHRTFAFEVFLTHPTHHLFAYTVFNS